MVYLIYIFIILLCVAFDQYSKQLVVTYIDEFEKIEIIPNFFNLTNVKNTGAAWSMLEGQQLIFIIITIIAVIYFSYELIKNKDKSTTLFKISCLLIIGGALGNFIDRITSAYVVDFLDFYIFGYDFPVFNLADTFLTIGVTLYIINSLLELKHAKD